MLMRVAEIYFYGSFYLATQGSFLINPSLNLSHSLSRFFSLFYRRRARIGFKTISVVSSNALASYPFKSARGEVLKLHGLLCAVLPMEIIFLIFSHKGSRTSTHQGFRV